MAALDAPTEPRIARSRQRRYPAPPPRRALNRSTAATIGTELPRTVVRVAPPVVPTHHLARPALVVEPERRRSYRWIGVLVAALAAGLATGAGLALSGVGVLPASRSLPTSAQALHAVQRLGPQQTAPVEVRRTFVVDPSSLLDLGGRVRWQAVGRAQATVDLGSVSPSDIHIQGTRISVRVPAAQLDPPVIDDSQSGLVTRNDRSTLGDLFSGGDVSASDVQPQAEQQLSDQAQSQGIPDAAQQQAIQQVRATLHRIGFRTVTATIAGS